MPFDVLPPSPSQPDSDVFSDSGYLSSLNSLPSHLSPECAVKEVSQEEIDTDMALFGFTTSVLVARKEITQQLHERCKLVKRSHRKHVYDLR